MTEMAEENNQAKEVKKESFIVSLKKEASKIVWPSKKSLKTSVKIVIISMFVFGLGIYCADLFVNKAVSMLNSVIFRLIG
ncbi:MAG: Protein translocase subunit SecE [Chlamydiia bacterium]|nr:Protein translocase subunit SecE [Chlamydiia bacterium]MCH9618626.1 Protein translocase subunit SecE [Chlamydiia bacterium]MCH9624346.1 Protein translocase subunit SecE [Chlamydiia bacterium]